MMITLDQQNFANPPAAYRTAPLWVWNDDMCESRIREQLKELKNHGFGGAFVHPRPGLITPYLTDEWFQLWAAALDEAEQLNMKLYIYDENSYPSGFAGGHVSSELPDCLANAVIQRELDLPGLLLAFPAASGMLNRPGHPIRIFAFKQSLENEDPIEIVQDITSLSPAEWGKYGERFLLFELGTPETNSWLGGFAYTDLLRPEVAQLFLSNTYEAYRSRFGEKFGTSIPAIFTDEPEISPGNLFQSGANFLPFSYWFAGQFEERNGYDLKDYLPCLFRNVTGTLFARDPQKVRYDYYHTIHELWVENFVRPISEWCEQHGIAWTGHYLEHNWPYPWGRTSPSVMSLYEYMQWPAIDMLRTNLLRQAGQEGMEPLMLVIREVHSAANQFNRERTLCETYGAGGWDSDFKDYKRIGDWLTVHGINFINQHLTFSTIVGARKRDHPQSFDWRQPWWEEYTELNDYFARVSYMLSQGETHNRILLLNPSTSGFLEIPGSQKGGLSKRNHPPQHPDMRLYLKIVQGLCDGQWNYDFGDEYIMERHGQVNDGKFIVGARGYDVVIFPDSMLNMKASTLKLLEQFLQSDGTVLALGRPSIRIDGEATKEAERLSAYTNWVSVAGLEELEQQLKQLLPVDLEWMEQSQIPLGVHHMRRILQDGSSVYFVVNSSPQAICSTLLIQGAHIEKWNLWTGKVEPVSYRRVANKVQVEVELPEEGSAMFRVYEKDQPVTSSISETALLPGLQKTRVPFLAPTKVTPERDNVLVLDYCDLNLGSKHYHGLNTIYAQRIIYEYHGFATNPWDNGVQFKRRLLDRNQFAESSGFEAIYHFHVAQNECPERLTLWVERSQYYQLHVNGQMVAWSDETSDVDHHLGAADITAAVIEGENIISLRAQPFDIHLELEPVILTGAFAVNNTGNQWVIGKKVPLHAGSWKSQGYPFYGYGMVYEQKVKIDLLQKRYSVRLPRWEGTVAALFINKKFVGLYGAGQGEQFEITTYLHEGENEVKVRVCGSLKNLFGPFHDADHPRRTAWPRNWKKANMFTPPSAEAYDLIDYGLLEEVIVECEE